MKLVLLGSTRAGPYVEVLRCIEPLSTANVVVGQYTTGEHGQPGYIDDETVPAGSQVRAARLCPSPGGMSIRYRG